MRTTTKSGFNGKEQMLFPDIDVKAEDMEVETEIYAFYHKELKKEVVTLKDAAELFKTSLQTIYNRIGDGKDAELTENLVVYEYFSTYTQETSRRFFLKSDFVKKRIRELSPPLSQTRNSISTVYYIVYEMLEDKMSRFRKNKNHKDSLFNMSDIDKTISKYIINKGEELLGEKLTPRKESLVRFSISSFYFGSNDVAKFILESLNHLHRDLSEGNFGDKDA